ncbi:MAG: lactate utilization protein C [Gammaproteobacteria bacterium]|nr:lactate utilization protein C [Gammaproteobacteria bacterium]NIR85816.1 lactate utilization protein C [Gammaproteobacteria bacterium]NIR90570.1 lactate utilization protein C [Gammaproteobacteria bacterium]NIU06951.1 lactate utilization protein C [Gammaproteobacteria bacterium]NIV53881.1 lactate utilization protein C [Gammaproteobacteria bacterium]
MTDARDTVLASIRRSLRRAGPLEASVAAVLAARTAAHAAHVQPRVSEDAVQRFQEKFEAAGGLVSVVPSFAEVPRALMEHLRAYALPPAAVMGTDELLSAIPWPNELATERRAATGEDRVSITTAFAAAAETGTLALLSSPESPTTLNFLTDDHVVVLPAARVVVHLEEIWSRLREAFPALPRTVNLISGPSKTADVEQTLQQGAHGPRRLLVILVQG